MPDPRWTGPPEQVALTFESGNPASVVANNVVWVTETMNKEVAAGLSTISAVATAASWQGVGSNASLVTNTGLNVGLHTLVGWTAHKIGVTQAAIQAFTVARSSVIPSLVSQTNRDEWAVLNATNFLGVNTPAIVERDTEYFGEHWPHNSSVGWAYSGALTALSVALSVPIPAAPMGASPAAPAAAGEAVAQASAQTSMNDAVQAASQAGGAAGQAGSAPGEAGGQLSSLLQQPLSMMSSMTEPLQQLVQAPMQAFQSIGSMPMGLVQSLGGMFSGAGGAPGAVSAGAAGGPALAGGGGAGGVPFTGGGPGAFPGAGLTSYTRPTSSFEPETGGRPTSLRAAVLDADEVRGRTVSAATGGTATPMSPAGMLARGAGGNSGSGGESDKSVARARVVVGEDPMDPR